MELEISASKMDVLEEALGNKLTAAGIKMSGMLIRSLKVCVIIIIKR